MGDYRPAGFLIRVAAAYLNIFIFISLILLTVIPLAGIEILDFVVAGKELSLTNPLLLLLLILALQLLADIALQGLYGWNVGKFILGLKVVDYRDQEPLGVKRILIRIISSIFAILPLGLGMVAAAFNKDKKALHDIVSNSQVIHDPEAKIPKALRNLIAFVMVLVFFTTLMFAPGTIFTSGYIVVNNFLFAQKIPSIESASFKANPNSELRIPLKNKELIALVKFEDKDAAYAPFRIDKELDHSVISRQVLEKLELGFLDLTIPYIKEESSWNFAKKIVIPELILKDTRGKDLVIKNAQFYIKEEGLDPEETDNVIGLNVLSFFNYITTNNNQSIILKMNKDQQKIFGRDGGNTELKNYKLYAINQIQKRWQERTQALSTELLEEFTRIKRPFVNDIELTVDTRRGYISKVHFPKPNKNDSFNELCKEFLQDLPRFSNIPKALKANPQFSFKTKLKYDKNL